MKEFKKEPPIIGLRAKNRRIIYKTEGHPFLKFYTNTERNDPEK